MTVVTICHEWPLVIGSMIMGFPSLFSIKYLKILTENNNWDMTLSNNNNIKPVVNDYLFEEKNGPDNNGRY